MKVYKYKDYDHFVERQTFYNKKKLHWVLIKEEHIEWMVSRCSFPSTIICHGTRNGKEQQLFKKHTGPSSYVIGTEISETATKFPMTVQHDFAIPKKEWIGYFDIVYSNSFDHSFDPDKTMTTWIEQLANNGKMFIDWNHDQNTGIPHESDPCSGSVKDFERFLIKHKLSFTKPPLRENIFGRDIFSGLYEITKQR